MTERTRCHVCGSENIAYWHTISPADKPYVMVNVAYCKDCAKIIDEFEQWLYRRVKE